MRFFADGHVEQLLSDYEDEEDDEDDVDSGCAWLRTFRICDRQLSRRRLPPVIDLQVGFYPVALQNHLAGLFLDPYADGLFARLGRAGVADDVVLKHEAPGFASHAYAGGFDFVTVVFNQIVFQAIAVAGHARAFVAEKDAVLTVEPHLVVFQKIVRVLVANRDPEAPVVLQSVLLKQPVPDTPAEVESILTVAPGNAFADHGPL